MKKYTVNEAAEILGYTPRRIQQMCKEGKLRGAYREGRSWVITDAYAAELPHKSGAGNSSRRDEPSAVRYVVNRNFAGNEQRNGWPMQLRDSRPSAPLPLPIGLSDYTRTAYDCYYVDKTLLIKEVIDSRASATLFTRPRRFGKTLNMDMLRLFFEKADRDTSIYFQTRKIWKCGEKYRSEQGQYPVIWLSFKDVKFNSWENSLDFLSRIISDEYSRHSELKDSPLLSENELNYYSRIIGRTGSYNDYAASLFELSVMLKKHYDKEVIIIIDEYDTPIQHGHSRGFYREVVDFMRILFAAALKDNPALSKAFLTGVLRVAKESILSGLNNLHVNSVADDAYGEYFGFTSDEVMEMLRHYGYEDRFEDICRWYDGYRFGDAEIFNPWSMINCMNNKCRLEPYWVSTGSNDLIGELLAEAPASIRNDLLSLMHGGQITADIDTAIIYPEIKSNPESIYSFLLVTGYLRLNGPAGAGYLGDFYNISIPNYEVSLVFRKEIIAKLQPQGSSSAAASIRAALINKDTGRLQKSISEYLLSAASYFDTASEAFYQGLMLGLLAIMTATHEVKSNRESGFGRFDIALTPRRGIPAGDMPGIIFELKRAESESADLDELAEAALSQISAKEYCSEMRSAGVSEIMMIGAAFRGKELKLKYSPQAQL